MSSDNNYKIKHFKISKTGNTHILYDASIIAEPTLQLFDRDYHTNLQTQQNNSVSAEASAGVGRAEVVYFSSGNRSLVLKHYFRGGAVASFIKDRYLGFNIENSRAFKEWRMLKKMSQLGLPVPQAVAAHVEKALILYRANLITEEIKEAKTLADVLSKKSIDAEQWKKIGACIRLFHQHNVYHADLNARNILFAGSSSDNASGNISEAGEVYLIDFDNSSFRLDSNTWKMANLARLKRSLLKFKKNQSDFNFDENDWSALLLGYDTSP
jgi:3-deoxy-D-manno-octulosonic acid kinase